MTGADLKDKVEELELGEPPKCQSNHAAWDNKVCTVEVTHAVRTTCANEPHDVFVCQAHADACFRRFDRGTLCGACGFPASQCWLLRTV